jgi:hypothetical protein
VHSAASSNISARYMCWQQGRSTVGPAGLLQIHIGLAKGQDGLQKSDIEQLDLWDGGPTSLIHMDRHIGPAPLEPAAGVMSRPLHDWGSDWDVVKAPEWADPASAVPLVSQTWGAKARARHRLESESSGRPVAGGKSVG